VNRFFLLVAATIIPLFVACGGDPNAEQNPSAEDAGCVSAPDADTPVPDSGTPVPDSGTQVPDSGTQVPDSGTQVPDSGTPVPDSGTPAPDSGTQVPDSGTQVPDSGTQVPDSGTPVPDAGTPEPELTTISPNDPWIQYTGRISFASSEPWFSHPGVSIKARFTGSTLNFLMKEFGNGSLGNNHYNVTIDNGTPIRVEVRKDTTLYEVARDLAPGEHTVVLTKRTESSVGSNKFAGFQIRGSLLEPPARPARRLEFIGDSMTCGYGNEVSIPAPPDGNPNTGFHSINENHDKTFAALTARALGAENLTVCYSGRGVYRNYDGTFTETIPLVYDRVVPDLTTPVWNFNQYVPDVVVINVGTNDLNKPAADETAFKKAYKDFVTRIRGNYPNAKIVCVVGVMLNDWYPSGEKAWTKAQTWVSAVVQDFNSRGDSQVYYLKLEPQMPPYGEDWHPTAATHQRMADTLVPFIRTRMGW
jgi:lysophospholipase L1-like esterase